MKRLLLLIFLATSFVASFGQQAEGVLLPTKLTTEGINDWSTLEGVKPHDSIDMKSKTIFVYYRSCVANILANLFIVEKGKDVFRRIELPENTFKVCGDETVVSITHKHINGIGLPEIIINWRSKYCGAMGALCSQYEEQFELGIKKF